MGWTQCWWKRIQRIAPNCNMWSFHRDVYMAPEAGPYSSLISHVPVTARTSVPLGGQTQIFAKRSGIRTVTALYWDAAVWERMEGEVRRTAGQGVPLALGTHGYRFGKQPERHTQSQSYTGHHLREYEATQVTSHRRHGGSPPPKVSSEARLESPRVS